jgi:hypothetical protein
MQAAASWLDQKFTTLPGDFQPGTFQRPGERLRSAADDRVLNLKTAITPGKDEYALTVQIQEGQKGAPPLPVSSLPDRLSSSTGPITTRPAFI